MQDLFQLGSIAQDAGKSTASDRAGRKSSGTSRHGVPGDPPNFEALLALAAAFAPQPNPAIEQQPSQLIDSALGPRSEDPAETSQFALSSHSRLSRDIDTSTLPLLDSATQLDNEAAGSIPDASADGDDLAIRNLLQQLAGQADSDTGDRPGAMLRNRLMQELEGQSDETHQDVPTRFSGPGAAQITAFPGVAANTRVAGAATGTTAPHNFAAARVDAAGAEAMTRSSDGADLRQDVPLDYRPVRRHVPVSTGTPQEAQPEPASDTLTSIERPIRWWQAEPAPGNPVSSRQFPEQVEGARPFWSRRNPDSIEATPRFDDGGLELPDLRVVARNDNPATSSTTGMNRPELHLIDFSVSDSVDESDDLISRLAGSWENTFVKNEDDQLIDSSQIPSLQLQSEETGERSDRDSADGSPAGPGAHELAASAGSDGGSAISPVPLFDEMLATRPSTGTTIEGEPAVAVRQAALEIASELRHLQRTGGSEISFNLRLAPEHLGAVEIDLQRVDNVWKLSIVAANDEARNALASEISRLENRFRESNLNLDSISVVTKSPDEAITGPAANDRSDAAAYRNTGQDDWAGGQNRDQSGWRKDEPARILEFDSRSDADPTQELTSSHSPLSDSGIDIKA